MELKAKILEVLKYDGHWVPSSFVAEQLKIKDLFKVESELQALARAGVINSNVNHTLGVKVFHALDTEPRQKRCPECSTVLKRSKCPNPTCRVDSVWISYKE